MGSGDRLLAPHVAGGQRVGAGEEVPARPGELHLAAVLAGPRPDVDDVLGGPDDLRVVLHDQDGVADVLERVQDLDEAAVVARVQPDGRLVQDEERPDQAGAQGGGQVDPLGLAAAQGEGHPVEGDVVEPDLEQELEPVLDLGDELLGDLASDGPELEPGEEGVGLLDRQPDHVADRQAADPDAQGLRVEAGLAGRPGRPRTCGSG